VAGGFSPLDEELGLLPHRAWTPLLIEHAVRLGIWMPFAHAVKQVAQLLHTQLSAATLTRLTEQAGVAYAAVQEAQLAQVLSDPGPLVAGPPLVQVSVDGAFVPLVHGVWVEAKTLVIGTVQPPVRTAAGRLEVHTSDLSYFSRVAECHTFTEQATLEILRRGTLQAGRVCGVVDGAVWEQDFLHFHCPGAVHILDWPHGVGYLARVAHALYGADTPESATWLAAQRQTLLTGDPAVVLDRLRGLADDLTLQTGAGPPPPALAVLEDTWAYLTKRLDQIQYAAFRAQGFPIGSGAVESANKLVVEARLKGAGMHWALEHVNPLLALRAMACSDRWEEAWPQVVRQWRAQGWAMTVAARQVRAAAQRTAREAVAAPLSPPLPLLSVSAPTAPVTAAPPQLALPPHDEPASGSPAPPLQTHTAPRRSRRPAATHPWRGAFSVRRSFHSPKPAM
jgi:hypothetical protein